VIPFSASETTQKGFFWNVAPTILSGAPWTTAGAVSTGAQPAGMAGIAPTRAR